MAIDQKIQPYKMNQSKGHLPFLDGIRCIAILSVFLYHALIISFGFDNLSWNGLFRDFNTSRSFLILYPFSYGGLGVAVFFVISGFCIHLSYQQNREKGWLNFFNRRFFRIYPPYLLAVFVFFFLWRKGSFTINSWPKLEQLVTHIFTIHNLYRETIFGINPSFWSIAVEIQLYIIYPILLLIIGRVGWRNGLQIAAGCEVLILILNISFHNFFDKPLPTFISASPFAYWFSWSIGAYLAQCFLESRSSILSKIRFDVTAVLAFALPFFKLTAPFKFMAFALLTGIAIDRLISRRWVIPTNKAIQLIWNHLSFLGVVSYSFYLFHNPFLGITGGILQKFFPNIHFHPLIKFSIYCAWYPIILMLSHFIYRTIEKPSIEIGKRVWNKIKKANPKIQTAPTAD